MKKITILLLFFTSFLFAQKGKSTLMARTSVEELKMTFYEKDPTAKAVVLQEHANHYTDQHNNYYTRIDYYYRIKIFDKSAFDLSTVNINLYYKQKIKNLQAITYNISGEDVTQSHLSENDIYTTKEGDDWTTKKFTMVNVKEGSVIEYSYSILSPYYSLKNWIFQSDIPKIRSEYDAAIYGENQYNIKLTGSLKLDKNESSIKKDCIVVDGVGMKPCLIYSFGMKDIPAFKEEDYMLSKKNYLSQISFDLNYFTNKNGVRNKYTTTWRNADIKLKQQFLNNQIYKINFFEDKLPENIIATENDLEKAKKIYTFIQNHYSWNKKNWNNKKADVKQAFDNKSGDVAEINISLYNSLKATNLEVSLVVLSTRDNGIISKTYPTIYDFNYVIVKTTINQKEYFLDATDKFLPFGQVPLRTLNGEARVLDLENESYWTTLKSKKESSRNIRTNLVLTKNGVLKGKINSKKTGYFSFSERDKIKTLTEESYLEGFEEENPDVEVESYKVNNLENLDEPLLEFFDVRLNMNEDLKNTTRINPFFFERLKTNPFKLKERYYPVDFGHPWKSNYALKLEVPENYTITKIPEDLAISLPNKGGLFILKVQKVNNSVMMYVRLNINKKTFTSEEYFALKDFFRQIIIAENSYITIVKKDSD